MADNNGILKLLVLAGLIGGGAYAIKKGIIKIHDRGAKVQNKGIAELKLKLAGIHAESDGTTTADIEVLNPTSLNFSISSIIGDIIVGGKTAGQIKMFGDTKIRPADQALLPVAVKVMPAAAAIMRTKGTPVQFRGEININNNVLPLTMSYNL